MLLQMNVRRMLAMVVLLLPYLVCTAQETQTDYNFLRLPVSAHAAGLGGDNVSIITDDASLIFSNPALLASVSDKTINLNFMTYMQGSVTGSASFTKVVSKRSTIGFGAQFIDYGSMKETTADNVELGTFSANDLSLSASYAYNLTDRLVGGVTAKGIYSHIGGYNSFAMGVDLGVNYFNENNDFSASLVARNLGGQLKAYDDTYEKIPFNMSLGITKRLKGAPFRPSVTFVDITDWTYDKLIEHFIVGTDVLLGNSFYLCAAYNFKRAAEMELIDGSNHGAGWSFGAGLELKRFKMQMAYAKYHISSSSFLINLSYSL